MISRALDRPDVPEFVVDHVMHHELLHKKHGLRWQDGRGVAHTREFRSEEVRFAQYEPADQFLRQLAAGKIRYGAASRSTAAATDAMSGTTAVAATSGRVT
jgi:hypothetical protein